MKYYFYLIAMVVLFGFQTAPVSAQWAPEGYSTGWLNYATDYLGYSTKCAAGQGEWDFVLQELNSHTALVNPVGLKIETVIWNDDTQSSRVGSVSYDQSAVESVCYNPSRESVWVRVRETGSLYYGYEPVGFSGYRNSSLAGRYMRGTVHLQRKSVITPPVAEALLPLNNFYRSSTPSFSFLANQATELYGANSNHKFWVWTWRDAGGRGPSNDFGGGNELGVNTVSLGGFSDGRYRWRFATRRNASFTVNQFNYDNSCGAGQRADVALREVANNRLIDMTGMAGTVEVIDNGAVVATRTFAAGAAVSPSFCITPNQQSVRLRLTASRSAGYLNNSGNTLTFSVGLVQNASGQNYHRFSAAVPERQAALINSSVTAAGGNTMQTLMLSNYYYRHSSMPEMGLSSAAPFVVDTTAPASSISATGAIVGSDVVLTVENTVEDITAGMRSTTVVIETATAGALEGSVTHNFTVGAGAVGGPRGQRVVTVPLTVTPGVTYQYYAISRDVAGNVTQTAPRSITVPQLPPDVNANVFSVTDPCESDEISLVAGNCPPIGLTLRIGNTGTRITSPNRVPYQIEYRLNGQSNWLSGPAGVWTAGIGATTGVTTPINLTLAGIRYGNHQIRARVNYPVNATLREMDMTDNISGVVNMAVAPEPAEISISSSQQMVRYGGVARISWRVSAPYALTCRVTGPGVARTFTHSPGVTDTTATPASSAALTSTQQFMITCSSNPIGGFTVSDVTSTQTVGVVPRAEEI